MTYLGMSKDAWGLLFDGAQAVAVVFAVLFGAYELREMTRQRAVASMEKMLEEWRRDTECRDRVERRMPLTLGSPGGRALALARLLLEAAERPESNDSRDLSQTLVAARRTVHQLNDLGGFLDRRGVRELDFFGHFHVRILELEFLLQPYILLKSTARQNRWGLRLRRLAIAAERYHYASRVHHDKTIGIRGHVILPPRPHRRRRSSVFGFRYLPSKGECKPGDDGLVSEVKAALEEAGIDREAVVQAIEVLERESAGP